MASAVPPGIDDPEDSFDEAELAKFQGVEDKIKKQSEQWTQEQWDEWQKEKDAWKNKWTDEEWAQWKAEKDGTATNGKGGDAAAPAAGEPPSDSNLIDESKAQTAIQWLDQDVMESVIGAKQWSDLDLSKELMEGIVNCGYVKPSKIQEAALPLICPPKSKNIIAQALNGSGKTATFSLGLLSNLDRELQAPQAMVLAPTRELVIQTKDAIDALGKFMNVSVLCVLPMGEKVVKGKCNYQVIAGTPGKVADLVKKAILNTDKIKAFILDEADVMLDLANQMGKDVVQIRKKLPADLQVLFFSATFPQVVVDFATQIVPNAAKIVVKNRDLAVDAINQMYMKCADDEAKYQAIQNLYGAMNIGQSIIFVNNRKKAFELAKRMKENDGHAVTLICGGGGGGNKGKGKDGKGQGKGGADTMDANQRDVVMKEFRDGVTKVLIATDVLARGIDVPAVTLVINYELPLKYDASKKYGERDPEGETYLHRVGRTGRFGKKGIAISLCAGREEKLFNDIRTQFGITATELDEELEVLEDLLKKLKR